MVNKKLEETYAQLEGKRRPKRRGLGAVRTALIAAALVAALCVTATAAYNIFRQEVPLEPTKTVPGILGSGLKSWERTENYNEYGVLEAYWPNREMVEVDPEQAQALVGDYLPEYGYQWQIGDYTFTVEGYLLDEHTGTAKFYYCVEHPGGFGDGAVDLEHGWLDNNFYRVSVTFDTMSDVSRPWFGQRLYLDVERSTEEKLYIVESMANESGWKAADGFQVKFTVFGETDRDDDVLSAQLELPGLKSLPTAIAADPATGKTAAELSSIGLLLSPGGDVEEADYIALDYADGSRYVVRDDANSLDNTDYGLVSGERPDRELRLVFNRLVDPSQVTAVIVDGQRYEVN